MENGFDNLLLKVHQEHIRTFHKKMNDQDEINV